MHKPKKFEYTKGAFSLRALTRVTLRNARHASCFYCKAR